MKPDSKKRTAQNWDQFARQPMFIPFFVYGRDDLDVGPLQGFCRGHGALGVGKAHEDTVGVYTAEGVYYNVLIDTRLECAVPQFFINNKPFCYPIVACYSMSAGLPAIDPTTGNMRKAPGQTDADKSAS